MNPCLHFFYSISLFDNSRNWNEKKNDNNIISHDFKSFLFHFK